MKKTFIGIFGLAIISFYSCNQSSSISNNNNTSDIGSPIDTLMAGDYILNFEEICSYKSDNFYNNNYNFSSENIRNNFADYFSKKDSILSLKLANGEVIKFIDFESDAENLNVENVVSYDFKYYFKDIDYYLLDVRLWEGGYGLLVNRKNGFSKAINGNPYISRNHKKILCINNNLESEYTVNGIELYTILNDSLTTEFRLPIGGWGPADINWINENQFLLKKERFENETRDLITEFKRVTISKKTIK
jgi:hypothetical protein